MQSKESFASGENLDNGLYHYKNKLGEVEARNVQSRMSDLYKPDFKKYLREARKMYDESELSDEAIFNIWKKQNLDKYPHPKETIDVNYDEIITQDLPKTKEVNVLENLQKLKPETIDELREEWVTMTNAERGGYAKDELEKAMREKAAVFENDLALKSIITQDLNAQNGVSYGVDKDKLRNLGIMSAENLEKGEKMSEQEVIKALENSTQKGRDMLVIGKENLSEAVLKWAIKNNKKIAVDILPDETAKKLGFKYPNVKRTIGASEMNHAFKRHGKSSNLVEFSKQPPLTLEKMKKWTDYADKADFHTKGTDETGGEVIISGKQINGYYVVVESVRRKVNELGFKDMYFENGNLLNHKDFKKFKKDLG